MATYLQLLQELAESRNEFLRNVALFDTSRRDAISQQFLLTEGIYLALVQNIMTRNPPVTITFPIINAANFMDSVLVTPSSEQISNEVEDYIHPSLQQCAICQDDISSDGARLRVCQHSFHRSCIRTWFGASVRCPVCRRDIREDPQAQTSSASTGISTPVQNQWGG
jgi:hypothetical protein